MSGGAADSTTSKLYITSSETLRVYILLAQFTLELRRTKHIIVITFICQYAKVAHGGLQEQEAKLSLG